MSMMLAQAMEFGGAEHAELELVAGEGEGRGAVAVRGVLREAGQGVHAELQLTALCSAA